jgi:hypothetical protein
MRLFLVVSFLCLTVSTFAQKRRYTTTSGELIFSKADYQVNGAKVATPLRFTCFFHFGSYGHIDLTKHLGFYTGVAIRNVGFTSSKGDTLIKRRNYYLGFPLAIKIGNLKQNEYLYLGVEADLAFNYKEKVFVDENRIDRFNVWFSDRTNTFMPSAFVGLNFKSGLNIKFKYYLRDFYNKDFTSTLGKNYENTASQIFYFSLSMNVIDKFFKDTSRIYNKGI